MVPHLVTALTGPINELEQRVLDSMPAIERWFRLEWMEHTPPFYSSVDIRNAGFKLAPVDTNLYPSGWQYLTPAMMPLAVQAAMAAIEKICPEARNLLIIPENPTKDTFYLASVAQLQRIFHMAGMNVRIGSINPEIKKITTIDLPTGERVRLEPVIRSKRRLGVKDFDPCTILLNNDLSAGVPGILERSARAVPAAAAACGLVHAAQEPAFPELRRGLQAAGQTARRRSVADQSDVQQVRSGRPGHGCGHGVPDTNVDALLTKIRRKYKEYGINEKPFVVIKADNSSTGFGIIDRARRQGPGAAASQRQARRRRRRWRSSCRRVS